MPKGKIVGIYPVEFQEAHDRATQFVNSKEGRFEADKQAAEIGALELKAQQQANELAELRALVKQLTQGAKPVAKKKPVKKVESKSTADEIKELISEEG
jgi:phosphoribosylaminoimidazole-succinocarboxamide synthase